MSQPEAEPVVESFTLEDDGIFPNSDLPVVLFRNAVPLNRHDPEASIEACFRENGWDGVWRDGIFDFHHYHATAHEVLGCAGGSVTVQLGGPNGREVTLQAGDVVVLPAGTAHLNLGASEDYRIVGAYPPDQSPDMCYGESGERPEADRMIAEVEFPGTDPVVGGHGPLLRLWGGV